MIIESLTDLAIWVINLLLSGFQALSLPVNFISVVLDLMKFGAWVLGGDLLALVFGNIFFWLGFKFSAGLILFIWRLIPLT